MIPNNLDGWTLDVVTALVEQGVFESDRFDFKEMLPPAKNEKDKLRLRKTCAAFANSGGGFLTVGVKDGKTIAQADRLVGLDPSIDFPEHFGNHPACAQPSVEWTFLNPPIKLGNGRVIHVVHIPSSPRKPHGLLVDDRWCFCKRTTKGTETMSYAEVRMAFLDMEMRWRKVALLRSELEHVQSIAQRVQRELAPENMVPKKIAAECAWMTRYPTTVVDSILGDAFSLLHDNERLWKAVAQLRDETRRSNATAEAYSHFEFVMTTKWQGPKERLYGMMRTSAAIIDENVCIALEAIRTSVEATVK